MQDLLPRGHKYGSFVLNGSNEGDLVMPFLIEEK